MSVNTPINSDPPSEIQVAGVSSPETPVAPRRRWRRWLLAASLLIALDASRPPASQPSALLTLGAIDLYQATLSKLMPSLGISCRFETTCSHYAEGAIRARGTWVGSALTARRLVRCGPWTPMGTVDPPPEAES